jgi:FMN-dependent NADH-azoreductase
VKLLRIDASPFGETAISSRLTDAFVEKWLVEDRAGRVIRRDLTRTDIPAIDAAWVTANYTPEDKRTREQNETVNLSGGFIRELTDADEYVIGLPMHNFGPPSRFKLWLDQIVTPRTLLERPFAGKRATFIIAAGRVYASGSPDANKNYLVPWLRTVFGALGIRDTRFVMAEGTKKLHSGDLDHATFLKPHLEAIQALFSSAQSPIAANEELSVPAPGR